VTELSAYKYRVFLSYSHRDKAWSRWLHAALENYPIAEELVGRETPAGSVPRTLRPIYRDREAAVAERPPSERSLAALRASQFLVVVCSRHAAKSRRVNEEIRRFTALGRADCVIPVIIDGEPGDPGRECFAPALRFRLESSLPPIDRRGEPTAPDARLDRDGKERIVHKVAAAALCLGLRDVEPRARAIRKRSLLLRCSGIAAALLALTLACDVGLAWARSRLSHDEPQLDRMLDRAATLTGWATAASSRFRVPTTVSVQVLGEAEQLIRGMAEFGGETPRLRIRRASTLIEFARMYAALGNSGLSEARLGEADRLMQGLAAESLGNQGWQHEVALHYDKLGAAQLAQGRFKEALASYRASLAIAERLASDPNNIDRQLGLALGHVNVGNAHLDQGALGPALTSYHSSLVIAEHLAAVDPGNAPWQHALLLAYEKIGDVWRLRGQLDTALASHNESHGIALRLVAGDPGNAEWPHSLSVSHVKIGDVLAFQNKRDEALASYRAAGATAVRLAAADPGSVALQKHLGIVHERTGLLLETRGDLEAAAVEYQASLALARRVAAADPGHTGWQRDLGIAHQHIGDLMRSRGDLSEALQHYRAERAIIERLTVANPGHAGWQYDLGASHARMGSLLEARGDSDAALMEYEACLRISSRFAAADPDNAGAQRDVAVSYDKLAAIHHRLGKSGRALAELRKGREIMAALLERSPEVAQWTQDLARFDGRIAALQGRGEVTAASAPPGSPTMASAPVPSGLLPKM
jgi:tetratricopeptide (TPR) repeat protein